MNMDAFTPLGASTQHLQAEVCQKYGWSYHYKKDIYGFWYVEVVVGKSTGYQTYRFTSHNNSNFMQTEKKHVNAEKDIVSAMALESLAPLIAQEEAKKCFHQLYDIFPNPIQIYDSAEQAGAIWRQFWNNPPTIVGIDTEGNQISPPVLIQISTPDFTILEAPPRNKSISSNLDRLLRDDNITKVFCDNFSQADKIALGMEIPANLSDYMYPPIVDLEVLSSRLFGQTKSARGLARIVTMAMPELNVRLVKPPRSNKKERFKNIGRFISIEQGKAAPLQGVSDLSEREQQYSALDSWCTLQAYLSILKQFEGVRRSSSVAANGAS